MLQYEPQVTANVRNHHADDHDDQQPQHQRFAFHLHDPSPSGIPRQEVLGRSRDLPSHKDCYELFGNDGGAGLRAWSPIKRTLASRSDICMPESASNSAGTCAAIFVMSPVSLYAPAASPLPVETMVTLSTLPSGSARARTTSGSPVMSLSRTAAWLYSWKASALTFMALASASPFLKMISASASPCARMAEARPSASVIER